MAGIYEDSTAHEGKAGIVIAKATQALLIAHQPGSVWLINPANVAVKFAEKLKGIGY